MSTRFRVEQLPTPLSQPETHLHFLIEWDSTRPLPLDADVLLRDAMEVARQRLANDQARRRHARPEWSVHA